MGGEREYVRYFSLANNSPNIQQWPRSVIGVNCWHNWCDLDLSPRPVNVVFPLASDWPTTTEPPHTRSVLIDTWMVLMVEDNM